MITEFENLPNTSESGKAENNKEFVVENHLKNIICRLEAIWNHLSTVESALTVAWSIYTLGQVMRRLDSIGINLGLEDEIGALTLVLEENEEPPVKTWLTYKDETLSLITKLHKWLPQAKHHEKAKYPTTEGPSDDS